MKVKLLAIAGMFSAAQLIAQSNVTSWQLNTNGATGKYWDMPGPTLVTMTDSSGVTRICTTSTHIYVKTKNLAGNYIMGPANNPNDPGAQNYTFKFPKSPAQQTGTLTTVPGGGPVGLAVNGVVLYGNRSADSYNSSMNVNNGTGDNIWHCDAWYNEKTTMDTSGNGHSDAALRYHYHANPSTLYADPSTAHSPIIGWALDGYPVYGPYGYSTAMSSSSTIKRLTSSYQLRSITTRTTLPDGSVSSPAGPNVSATFPLGMYVEDYQYMSGSGDLDTMNGRFCVTPEYPSGTYAYFLATDNTGTPAFPYIFNAYYYGVIATGDAGPNVGNATIPSTGVTCITQTTGMESLLANNENVLAYPNPATDVIHVELRNADFTDCSVTDVMGKVVLTQKLDISGNQLHIGDLAKGVYFVRLSGKQDNHEVIRFVKD